MRLVFTVFALTVGPLSASAADPLDGFDDAIRRALKLHSVPGVGIAIVKEGKVVLAKGYGVRTLGKPDAVTENTVFAIGSVSKSFAATTAAALVGDGKLTWATRVQDSLPNVRLADPYMSREIRLRDLLCHRVGLTRHDMVWYGSSFTSADLLARLPDMEPPTGFRTNFEYNNILFMVAGEMVAKAAGKKSWEEVVAERVFQPLGMTSASTSTKQLSSTGDVATPHERKAPKPIPVPWLNLDCVAAAGSINASAADMAKYLQFQLGDGKFADKRLVKRAAFQEMHKPQFLIPKGSGLGGLFNPTALSSAYGFGWFVSDYAGRTLLEHGGNVDGMSAQVGFLPDEQLGVVVLSNLGTSALPAAVMFDVFDRYLGKPVTTERVDGTSLLMWAATAGTAAAEVKFDAKKRAKDAQPPVPLTAFAGKFTHKLYAPVEVTTVDGVPMLKWTNFQFKLEHWQHGTFRGVDPNKRWPTVGVHFQLSADGVPNEVKLQGLNVDDVVFKR